MEPKHAFSRSRLHLSGAFAWLTTNVMHVLHRGGIHPRSFHRFDHPQPPCRLVEGLPMHAIARQSWLRTKNSL